MVGFPWPLQPTAAYGCMDQPCSQKHHQVCKGPHMQYFSRFNTLKNQPGGIF